MYDNLVVNSPKAVPMRGRVALRLRSRTNYSDGASSKANIKSLNGCSINRQYPGSGRRQSL